MQTDTDTTYNGWANWDTWNAHLWLSNDYDTYTNLLDALRRRPASRHGHVCYDALRDCVAAGDARRDGMAWDGIDFDAVVWDDVAAAFADDLT